LDHENHICGDSEEGNGYDLEEEERSAEPQRQQGLAKEREASGGDGTLGLRKRNSVGRSRLF